VQAPLVKAYVLQISAETLRQFGFSHPLGDGWRGIHDFNPSELTRERILALLKKVDVQAILATVPHGTPLEIARILKGYAEAGMRIYRLFDYGGMAGLKFAARSAEKVRRTEDELTRLLA
jgi:phthiodiolone/phenolphthiodiolone dimycocerosates ketoreductase